MRLVSRTLVCAIALLVLPATARAEIVYETYDVPVLGGTETVNVEVERDTRFERVPALLTYSPYNTLSEPEPAAGSGYAQRGYARVTADVLGTRDSTGCWDYGGPKEVQSGVDVVNWLAERPWSNGRVGMMGGSYDGTTATMVASRGKDVKPLKAIVPIAAISRWYGYAYQDGVRFLGNSESATDEGFDTPLAFDFGFGKTVGPKGTGAADRADVCESVEHTQRGYSPSPDYDDFWLSRDYRKDADEIRAAVLLVHGWQDYNVKQEEATALWETGLKRSPLKRLYLSQGRHGTPSSARYRELLAKFLDATLKGDETTGIEQTPEVITVPRMVTSTGFVAGKETDEASWPPAGTEEQRLFIRRKFDQDVPGVTVPDPGTGETGTLEPEPNTSNQGTSFLFVDTGTQSEEVTTRDPLNEPGHGYYSLFHQSAPLKAPMRIAGSVVLDTTVRASSGSHLSPVLTSIAPDGTQRVIGRGFMNLDYREGLAKAKPAGSAWVKAQVRFLPQDVVLPAGHKLGLLLQGSNDVWALPGTPGPVSVAMGPIAGVTAEGSSLRIPVAPVR